MASSSAVPTSPPPYTHKGHGLKFADTVIASTSSQRRSRSMSDPQRVNSQANPESVIVTPKRGKFRASSPNPKPTPKQPYITPVAKPNAAGAQGGSVSPTHGAAIASPRATTRSVAAAMAANAGTSLSGFAPSPKGQQNQSQGHGQGQAHGLFSPKSPVASSNKGPSSPQPPLPLATSSTSANNTSSLNSTNLPTPSRAGVVSPHATKANTQRASKPVLKEARTTTTKASSGESKKGQISSKRLPRAKEVGNDPLLPGFVHKIVTTCSGVNIHTAVCGEGRGLLLLHGLPQTHASWHRVASVFSRGACVVATDLRGTGESSKPPGAKDHSNYSVQAMAADQNDVMAALGFDSYAVVGHGRGASIAFCLAAHFPERVSHIILIDQPPLRECWASTNFTTACSRPFTFLMIHSGESAEAIIPRDPRHYLQSELRAVGSSNEWVFTAETVQEYERVLRDAQTVHGIGEHIRASCSLDVESESLNQKQCNVKCPVLVLWGQRGCWGGLDVVGMWRAYCAPNVVAGVPLQCGHYSPEEAPIQVVREVANFLALSVPGVDK